MQLCPARAGALKGMGKAGLVWGLRWGLELIKLGFRISKFTS
jgi:hypothetical protein